MAKDLELDDEFERIKVEQTKVVDISQLNLDDNYTEEKLQWFTLDQLHDIIKHRELPKDVLKLIKKVIKQKKKEK